MDLITSATGHLLPTIYSEMFISIFGPCAQVKIDCPTVFIHQCVFGIHSNEGFFLLKCHDRPIVDHINIEFTQERRMIL